MCNKRRCGAVGYELLLNEWQLCITRKYSHGKNFSINQEHFSITLESATSCRVPPTSVFLCANMSSGVVGNQLLYTQKGGSQA